MNPKPFLLLVAIVLSSFSCQEADKKATTKDTLMPNLTTMIGQMIMVGTRGMTIEEVSPQFQQQIKEGKIGGIVLFDYCVLLLKYIKK